ncbi:MAG: hypothetical protein ACLP7O_14330 [Terracidiphilus sp.]
MSIKDQFGEEPDKLAERAEMVGDEMAPALYPIDENLSLGAPELAQVLKNFRASVLAWSDAAYSRPRTAVKTVRQRSWRLAAGWALGCALVAGGVSGGVHERHHRQELARMAAARAAEQQRLVAEQRVREEEEDLLAKVDSDVSREVPSAMEPLAQLMAEDEAR